LTGRLDAARRGPERISGHPNRWAEKKKKKQKKKRQKREEMKRIKRIPNELLSVFPLWLAIALEKKGHHHLDGSARTEDTSQTDPPTDPLPYISPSSKPTDVYTVDGISIIKMIVNERYNEVRCKISSH
jgi:hypothetical protein